jgi:hypothetical protein
MLYDPKKFAMPEIPVFRESDTVEALKVARARIADRWCPQGGTDEMGGVCIIAALGYAAPWQSREYESARNYMRRAIPIPNSESLPEWNDAAGRTQGEVIAAFDRAIALARAHD